MNTAAKIALLSLMLCLNTSCSPHTLNPYTWYVLATIKREQYVPNEETFELYRAFQTVARVTSKEIPGVPVEITLISGETCSGDYTEELLATCHLSRNANNMSKEMVIEALSQIGAAVFDAAEQRVHVRVKCAKRTYALDLDEIVFLSENHKPINSSEASYFVKKLHGLPISI